VARGSIHENLKFPPAYHSINAEADLTKTCFCFLKKYGPLLNAPLLRQPPSQINCQPLTYTIEFAYKDAVCRSQQNSYLFCVFDFCYSNIEYIVTSPIVPLSLVQQNILFVVMIVTAFLCIFECKLTYVDLSH